MPARTLSLEFIENGLRHRGIEFLRRQAVAAADDDRLDLQRGEARGATLGQRAEHVEVERLAERAGLLRAVEHGDAAHGGRHRIQKIGHGERAVEAHLQHADALATGVQHGGGFLRGLGAGADDDNHAVGLGMARVFEETVATAREFLEAIHEALDDVRKPVVEAVRRLACLEEHVGILRGAANDRMLGRDRATAIRGDPILVDHRVERLVLEQLDLRDLVRGAEAVEEMHHRTREASVAQ